MSIHYYKMANSNTFSNVALLEYIKHSEDNWKKISDDFSNSIFSAAVSVLSGIKIWEYLEGYSIVTKTIVSFWVAFVFFIFLNLFVSKIMSLFKYIYDVIFNNKISKEKEHEIREYFYTELQPLVVMGLSLSQRILDGPNSNQNVIYKVNLDKIYLYQCLYYFDEILKHSLEKKIYNYGNNDQLTVIIGKEALIGMYDSIIHQLKQLKERYNDVDIHTSILINSLLDGYEDRLSNTKKVRV